MTLTRTLGVLALSLTTLAATNVRAQDAATGFVFLDANSNGTRDSGEAGLADVFVSNGRTLVKTDATGRYTLPVSADTTLFVVKPRNFMTSLDPQLALPRFYYHHKPAGTNDKGFIFRGIAPTGPLPASVDFPLYPRPEGEKFDVALFGDPQPYTTSETTFYARDVVSEFAGLSGTAFGVALGDLVGDNLDLFKPYAQANAVAGFPWYNVLGNHDLNFESPNDADSDSTFRAFFGPSTYFFQHGRAHFIVLNNVFWPGHRGYRADGWPRRGHYLGRIRPEHLDLIRAYVSAIPRDDAVVVLSHIPMIGMKDGDGPAPATQPVEPPTPEFPQLLDILSGHRHTFSASAHTHIQRTYVIGKGEGFAGPDGAVHIHHNASTIAGTWYAGEPDERGIPLAMQRDGTPRGYLVASFDGPRFAVRYQGIGLPASEQMRIDAPDIAVAGREIEIAANVFNASERSTARMRWSGPVEEKGWRPMTRQRRVDPLYAAMQARSVEWARQQPGRRALSAPAGTDKHFVATLPLDLPPGLYRVEVETTDVYGHVYRSFRAVRVVESESAWADLDRNSIRRQRPGTTRPANGGNEGG
jgi:hypothetical protein